MDKLIKTLKKLLLLFTILYWAILISIADYLMEEKLIIPTFIMGLIIILLDKIVLREEDFN